MKNLYLSHLNNLNQKIQVSEGSVEKLLKLGARNDLFYLEALCRLDLRLQKKMKKWLDKFKKGEDLLGKLDFYLWTIEEVNKKKISPKKKYCNKKCKQKSKNHKKRLREIFL